MSETEENTQMPRVRIHNVANKFALLVQYPNQCNPQQVYLELDIATGDLTAEADPEIGGAIPMRTWNGITRRYPIQTLTADAANDLMAEISELAQRVIDGSEVIWNGNNHVAALSEDADHAEDIIEILCDDTSFADTISNVDAEEYLHDIKDTCRGKTDAELGTMAEEYDEEAADQNMAMSSLDTLLAWRDEFAAEDKEDN